MYILEIITILAYFHAYILQTVGSIAVKAMVFNDQENLNNTIACTAMLPTVCKIYAWKNAKMVIISKKGNKKYLKNFRPICLLSNIYKALTKALMKRQEKTLS